jgi:hypothetical protein
MLAGSARLLSSRGQREVRLLLSRRPSMPAVSLREDQSPNVRHQFRKFRPRPDFVGLYFSVLVVVGHPIDVVTLILSRRVQMMLNCLAAQRSPISHPRPLPCPMSRTLGRGITRQGAISWRHPYRSCAPRRVGPPLRIVTGDHR